MFSILNHQGNENQKYIWSWSISWLEWHSSTKQSKSNADIYEEKEDHDTVMTEIETSVATVDISVEDPPKKGKVGLCAPAIPLLGIQPKEPK